MCWSEMFSDTLVEAKRHTDRRTFKKTPIRWNNCVCTLPIKAIPTFEIVYILIFPKLKIERNQLDPDQKINFWF